MIRIIKYIDGNGRWKLDSECDRELVRHPYFMTENDVSIFPSLPFSNGRMHSVFFIHWHVVEHVAISPVSPQTR